MAKLISYTHTFGGLSSPIPLSYLDDDYGNVYDAVASLNTFGNYFVDTGAINAYAVTLGAGYTFTLSAGLPIQVLIANTNTGASTLAINGGTAQAIKATDGSAMVAGQLRAGAIVSLQYDGTNYQLVSQNSFSSSFTATLTGCTTSPTYTVSYRKDGNRVTIDVPDVTATSNAVGKTLTGMPAVIQPTTQKEWLVMASDNGGAYVAARATLSSGTITLYTTASAGAWTAAGVMDVRPFSFTYLTV